MHLVVAYHLIHDQRLSSLYDGEVTTKWYLREVFSHLRCAFPGYSPLAYVAAIAGPSSSGTPILSIIR